MVEVIWPSLISRYVLRELAKVFLVVLAALMLLMVLVGVTQEALRRGLGLVTILRLVPYTIPSAMVPSLPTASLLSVCTVYGRISASNEIIAVKAAGLSPSRLVRPVLVVALVLSLANVWLVNLAFSWGYEAVRRVVLESVEEVAYGVLRTRHYYNAGAFSIHVAGVDGRRLVQPTIHVRRPGAEDVTLTAREAEMVADLGQHSLKFTLTDGTIEAGPKFFMRFPDTIQHAIPLDDTLDGSKLVSPSHLRLGQMAGEKKHQRVQIRHLQQAMAADAACQLLTGDFDRLASSGWTRRHGQLDGAFHRLWRLNTEPYRRWASGFSGFCFVLVGIPLAIRLRNADLMATFGMCFFPILAVYYPLFAFGLDRAKSGLLPPYIVWLGNVVCVAVGLWSMRQVLRH